MAKDPAFLMYSQDFLTGTMAMSFEDRGKYITILLLMHQQGRMKEETIRFLVGSVSDTLRLKFKVDENGFWYNERLELESEKRSKFTASRRENGSKGGRPKKNKTKKVKKPIGFDMDNHMGNEIENENDIVNGSAVEKEKSEFEIFVSEWFDFFDRSELPKPGFDGAQGNALKAIIKKIKESSKQGSEPIDSFKYILNNWKKQSNWIRSNALDLKIFNSKFNVIINDLKNGKQRLSDDQKQYLVSRTDL